MNPLANLAARARSVDEGKPVARRRVALLRDDFDHVAIGQRVAQRNHFAIHFCAGALMAHFGVDRVREIHRRGAARQHHHAPLRREGVNLFGIQIHAQGGKKFARLLHLLHPFDQVAHPDDALIVGRATRLRAPPLYFQCAATPCSAMRCISCVRICTSKGCPE